MPDAPLLLALDQGTSSSRAIVFDSKLRMLSLKQQETRQFFPQPGWVNQDANDIWQSTLDTARSAISTLGDSAALLATIGISNQRETLIVWDRATSQPVHPAIVWQSRQSTPQVESLLKRDMGDTYTALTGLVPDAYFTATKLAWLFESDTEVRSRAEVGDILAGTVDSWLIWNLTGGAVHATDVSNASRTMLFDIDAMQWSPALLSDLQIPAHVLPRVVANSGAIGVTEPSLLGMELPISGCAGDQQAALFGQLCFEPGDAKNTFGTGTFLLMNVGKARKPSTNRLLSTVAWEINGEVTYALEGSVFSSGAAVQWLRDGLGIIATADEVEALAATVPDSGGVAFVPAFTGLGAPHWDPNARGAIVGITRGTTKAHIARATLDALVYLTHDLVVAMAADAGMPLTSLKVDGGGARNDLLLQLLADALGVPVVRPQNVESTALGAVLLAGLGAGVWSETSELRDSWKVDRVFEPNVGATSRARSYADWQNAVSRAKGWAS